ncbi:hypothetical protein OIU76_021819 [Salix suchowensis]|nr:hypothetical protein OIU76_021819 [Salix suchowensis]KAJ6385353.1 hypothetical protein OIU77_028513 [Salix suchowensis]
MIPLLSLHTPRPSLFLTHFPPHLSTPLPRFKSPPPKLTIPASRSPPCRRRRRHRCSGFNEFFLAIWVEQITGRSRNLGFLEGYV